MNEINKHDARYLCAKELGVDVGTMDDGELVILHSDDLSTLQSDGVPANTVYFGDFVIQGYDVGSVAFGTTINSAQSILIAQGDGLLPIGNILPCVMFDAIANYSSINAHFYGWKFTLQP